MKNVKRQCAEPRIFLDNRTPLLCPRVAHLPRNGLETIGVLWGEEEKSNKRAIPHITTRPHTVMAKTLPRQRLSPTTTTATVNGAMNNSEDHRPLVTKQDSKDSLDETETEADIARRNHDYFNLVALVSRRFGTLRGSLHQVSNSYFLQVPVVVTLLQNWDLEKLFSFSGYPESCYTGEFFYTNWAVRGT